MFLKKIYINGFKSFAERTEIIVEKGITAVVGPNGSGKSNISDSIKWVLGEQSAKSLRGGKMDDVIFAGTEKRLPLGFAEVRLVFDNESGIIPVEYKEVSISRKLYKTGESEYYINKQQCRLKDIKELFMDTGIGREGYSFIGQGRVEDILSPNSETRRQVFEEAAGIVKYKNRKEEAYRKLEKTSDNLDRINDIVYELSERIDPLYEQSSRAKQYLEIKEDLKKLELNYLVREYEKHHEQYSLLENQKKSFIEQKQSLYNKIERYTETVEHKKTRIHEVKLNVDAIEENKESKKQELEKIQNITNVSKEKNTLLSSTVEGLNKEIQETTTRKLELNNNINILTQEIEALNNLLDAESKNFGAINDESKQFKLKIEEKLKAIDEQKNNLFELHKRINKLNSQKSTIDSFVLNNDEKIEQLTSEKESEEKERQNKISAIESLKLEQEENAAFLAINKEKLKSNNNRLKELVLEKDLLLKEMSKLNEETSHARTKMNILTNMENFYDGYFKSVKTLMNNKDKDATLKKLILGTVGDIIKTKKEYEVAIEVALGSAIQNVIVNNDKEAEYIIEYLKESKIGRVTFLPINMLSQRALRNDEIGMLSDACVIDTADKLVEASAKYSTVVNHLLGRIVIVDSLQNGFKLSKKLGNTLKIVTLQGEVINAGGSVTGGFISKEQNLLSRKREIEELKSDIQAYLEKSDRETKFMHQIEEKINDLNDYLSRTEKEISEKNNIFDVNNSKINMTYEQINKLDSMINKYKLDISFLNEEKIKYKKQLSEIEEQLEETKKNIKNNEKIIEDSALENDIDKTKIDEYQNIIQEKRDKLTQLAQEKMLKAEKISNMQLEINRNDLAVSLKKEKLISTTNEIKDAKSNILTYQDSIEKLSQEINALNQTIQIEKEKLEKDQNEVYTLQDKINQMNTNITEILDEENKLNLKIERENLKVEDISNRLWEDYELNYAMALSYKDDAISFTRLLNDVNLYKKQIKELGNINLDSIEEYEEVKKRFDFITKQKSDLIEARQKLESIIKELEDKMREKFLEEFANIRKKFNEVFNKLFNGGNGDVYLENEQDALNSNIEIDVQPQGKKLTKISLLSGGEKSLTAIALLFAILKTKPTPFCVLDEIEAALDDVNINRFSQYLHEFSKETQFIVITHRKGTMECADTLYGATMEEKGITKLLSLKLSDANYEQ